MSETFIIAIIGVISSFLCALIGAFATIQAATIRAKSDNKEAKSKPSCGIIGLVASIAAVVGLIIGSLFAAILLQQLGYSQPQGQSSRAAPQITIEDKSDETTQPAVPQTSSNKQYDDWVMCWHGRDGYEYLIAYPENDVRPGINLNFKLTNAQGHQVEVANDSLKMCYVNGEWYGRPDSNPWFPTVSYIKLLDNEILVCSDSPGCKGNQWTMLPEKYFPWNAPELQEPNETGIHIIAYKSSQ